MGLKKHSLVHEKVEYNRHHGHISTKTASLYKKLFQLPGVRCQRRCHNILEANCVNIVSSTIHSYDHLLMTNYRRKHIA